MAGKILDQQQLKAVCDVLAHASEGFSKSELSRLLQQSQIDLADDGSSNNGYSYTLGLNKRDWLYNCLVNEINTNKSFQRVFDFIVKALNPVAFTVQSNREKYLHLLEETNKVLLLAGLSVSKEGKIVDVVKATTLDEVDRRVNHLKRNFIIGQFTMRYRNIALKIICGKITMMQCLKQLKDWQSVYAR